MLTVNSISLGPGRPGSLSYNFSTDNSSQAKVHGFITWSVGDPTDITVTRGGR